MIVCEIVPTFYQLVYPLVQTLRIHVFLKVEVLGCQVEVCKSPRFVFLRLSVSFPQFECTKIDYPAIYDCDEIPLPELCHIFEHITSTGRQSVSVVTYDNCFVLQPMVSVLTV